MVIGLGAALLAAVLFGVAGVVQAIAARRYGLFSWMMVGVGVTYLLGWGLHLVAIAYVPLYVAQVGIALSLVVTAILAATVVGEPLALRHWIAIATMVVGLVLVVVAAGPVGSTHFETERTLMLYLGSAVTLVLGLLAARWQGPASGVVLGALAGIAYGGSPISTRALVDPHLNAETILPALTVVSYGLLGFWLCSLAPAPRGGDGGERPADPPGDPDPGHHRDHRLRRPGAGGVVAGRGHRVRPEHGRGPGAVRRRGQAGAPRRASARAGADGWMGRMTAPSADVSARVAWADDAPAIAAVQVRAWRDVVRRPAARRGPRVPASRRHRRRPGARHSARPADARNRVIVALERNLVTGFVVTGPAGDPDCDPVATGELTDLTVDPHKRGAGHGSRLLQAGVDTLVADRFTRAVTWLPAEDDDLRAFLTEAGWGPDGAHRTLDLLGDGTTTVKQVRLHTALVDATPH